MKLLLHPSLFPFEHRVPLRSLVRGIAFWASRYLGAALTSARADWATAVERCIINLRREAFDVRMPKLPERLPHPPPVLEPRVLHEVGLADVPADGREEVHERLQRKERKR